MTDDDERRFAEMGDDSGQMSLAGCAAWAALCILIGLLFVATMYLPWG
jgi:hypothetical protein